MLVFVPLSSKPHALLLHTVHYYQYSQGTDTDKNSGCCWLQQPPCGANIPCFPNKHTSRNFCCCVFLAVHQPSRQADLSCNDGTGSGSFRKRSGLRQPDKTDANYVIWLPAFDVFPCVALFLCLEFLRLLPEPVAKKRDDCRVGGSENMKSVVAAVIGERP